MGSRSLCCQSCSARFADGIGRLFLIQLRQRESAHLRSLVCRNDAVRAAAYRCLYLPDRPADGPACVTEFLDLEVRRMSPGAAARLLVLAVRESRDLVCR